MENLQTHSKLIPLVQKKVNNKKMKTYEFGASLERVWRISKLTPNSKKSLLDVIFQLNEFGESPNSLQTQKKYACTTFFQKKKRAATQKKHGSLNVPIEHHPTIRYMVYNGYYKVMFNIPKMGQLPTFEKSCARIKILEILQAHVSFFIFFGKMTSSKDFFVSLE